jgi:hypothetical protein
VRGRGPEGVLAVPAREEPRRDRDPPRDAAARDGPRFFSLSAGSAAPGVAGGNQLVAAGEDGKPVAGEDGKPAPGVAGAAD